MKNSGFHGNRNLPSTYNRGKCCPIDNYSIFDRSFVRFAGNKGILKISEMFDFGPDQTIHFGFARP